MHQRGSSTKFPRPGSVEPSGPGDPTEDEDSNTNESNISVVVRVRGMIPAEYNMGGRSCIEVEGNSVILKETEARPDDYLRVGKCRRRTYQYSHVFDHECQTSSIYHTTVANLVGAVMKGFNATVFAYGATGAGKTHTMLGSDSSVEPDGIMSLAAHDLFRRIHDNSDDGPRARVKCSFLEVYNENIYDLLVEPSNKDQGYMGNKDQSNNYLDLREDPIKGMIVSGLSWRDDICDASDIMELLHFGNKNRTCEPTDANQVSSRSHAVFCVILEQDITNADGEVGETEIAKLSMIDLAGSERASATNNRGIRLLEGANINRSLLSLANCITALSEKIPFVPYRDSKLTRLLKDSLGGNTRTVMIANVTPCHHQYEDSHNTLKYAQRATSIKTKSIKNVVSMISYATKYTDIIKDLREEIVNLKSKLVENEKSNANNSSQQRLSHIPSSDDIDYSMWEQQALEILDDRNDIRRGLSELIQRDRSLRMERSKYQIKLIESGDHKKIIEEVHRIDTQLKENENFRQSLQERLDKSIIRSKEIENELRNQVQTSELQHFLSSLYRLQAMEIEHVEVSEETRLTDLLIKQKDWESEKLKQQIILRDKIITEQASRLIGNIYTNGIADKENDILRERTLSNQEVVLSPQNNKYILKSPSIQPMVPTLPPIIKNIESQQKSLLHYPGFLLKKGLQDNNTSQNNDDNIIIPPTTNNNNPISSHVGTITRSVQNRNNYQQRNISDNKNYKGTSVTAEKQRRQIDKLCYPNYNNKRANNNHRRNEMITQYDNNYQYINKKRIVDRHQQSIKQYLPDTRTRVPKWKREMNIYLNPNTNNNQNNNNGRIRRGIRGLWKNNNDDIKKKVMIDDPDKKKNILRKLSTKMAGQNNQHPADVVPVSS